NKTTVPDVHCLLCGPHQDSAREAESPEARSGAWRCVHAYAVGQAARLCSAETQARMPDSSPATLAAALPLRDQALVWLGWYDHPGGPLSRCAMPIMGEPPGGRSVSCEARRCLSNQRGYPTGYEAASRR